MSHIAIQLVLLLIDLVCRYVSINYQRGIVNYLATIFIFIPDFVLYYYFDYNLSCILYSNVLLFELNAVM
jgi:hypothetical protein